ncbi:uncharacterized protein A4U43_C01F22390 [Asparagus officinalis]|uniref:Uncharacterized protein n=1 Tax=Asparagus officinalis TaxID=4686 RepID=A0A5P1FRX0_ASPOF|nr:uncharacterized protein A4U43_C01F22390 [Asparagus officinalis]
MRMVSCLCQKMKQHYSLLIKHKKMIAVIKKLWILHSRQLLVWEDLAVAYFAFKMTLPSHDGKNFVFKSVLRYIYPGSPGGWSHHFALCFLRLLLVSRQNTMNLRACRSR